MREDWESHTGHQPGAEPWHTRHFGTMSRAQQNTEIYKVMLCGHYDYDKQTCVSV